MRFRTADGSDARRLAAGQGNLTGIAYTKRVVGERQFKLNVALSCAGGFLRRYRDRKRLPRGARERLRDRPDILAAIASRFFKPSCCGQFRCSRDGHARQR